MEKNYKKKALITGITGQIGSYLAELLIEKEYEVYGITRKNTKLMGEEDRGQNKNIKLINGDLGNLDLIEKIINKIEPDEIYNLGGQSSNIDSFKFPEYTFEINSLSVLRICETVKKMNKPVKIYQAGSSEMYGNIKNKKVNEDIPFNPSNPYAVSKLASFYTLKYFRETHKMFCANGICFNAESPRRGKNLVTRKITKGIADILKGKEKTIKLGNLNAKRDWTHAKDTARAIWLILQQKNPDDYIIASGEGHSIKEFIELAFKEAGIKIEWKGSGLGEQGYSRKTGRTYIEVNPEYFRKEDSCIIGDVKKIQKKTGWKREYKLENIVKEMMEHDLK